MGESEFERIIEEAISKAQKVRCPKEVYHEGLRGMLEHLESELGTAGE